MAPLIYYVITYSDIDTAVLALFIGPLLYLYITSLHTTLLIPHQKLSSDPPQYRIHGLVIITHLLALLACTSYYRIVTYLACHGYRIPAFSYAYVAFTSCACPCY